MRRKRARWLATAAVTAWLTACGAGRSGFSGEVAGQGTKEPGGEVSVAAQGSVVTIENARVSVRCDLAKGTFLALDKADGSTALAGAFARVNDLSSAAEGLKHAWKTFAVNDRLGAGKTLEVTSARAGQPSIISQITLYEGKGFLSLAGGIDNVTGKPLRVKEISLSLGAAPFPDLNPKEKVMFLDGPGGAGAPHVRRGWIDAAAINNLLLTFETPRGRRSLVCGGLTYRDFVKCVAVGRANESRREDPGRRQELEKRAPEGCRQVAYLDCGVETSDGEEGAATLHQVTGDPFRFSDIAGVPASLGTVAFDDRALVFKAAGLDPKKAYLLGFSWWDHDHKGRAASVSVATADGGKGQVLLGKQALPAYADKGMMPEERMLAIPASAYDSGSVRISFTNEAGPNVTLSEVWLWECQSQADLEKAIASVGAVRAVSARPVPAPVGERRGGADAWAVLRASDPVGRRVAAGSRYLPDDRFYVDFTTANPFEALEQYGLSLRAAQDAKPNAYDFPTVCAWYAFMNQNHTPRVVEEMDHVVKSGFLKYSRVAVRLVPDANEQGWWDDAHWQRAGHYRPPYETTKKFGEAVAARGGLAFTYFQVGQEPADYGKAYPQRMLFNDPAAKHDYTDPATIKHLQEVYAGLREGGIRGMMFDYPETGYQRNGGFEDKSATAGWAYRNIFALAKEGLGPDSWVHERILGQPLSDITLGAVDSQRTWGDTRSIDPAMVSNCGLRWYKNRVVVSYDMDSKDLLGGWRYSGMGGNTPEKLPPGFATSDRDGRRMLLTMAYVAAGRLLLATSFQKMTPEVVHDLSRTFPYHSEPKSARPADAFVREGWPQIYDFAVSPRWHQVTFYNTDLAREAALGVNLSGDTASGALGLDPAKEYYVYDFWNDRLAGKLKGDARLEQTLRPGEARMMSLHQAADRPQFIATNRHIMQGYVDLSDERWDPADRRLGGKSRVVAGETYKIVIATNGHRPAEAAAGTAKCGVEMLPGQGGLAVLSIDSPVNATVDWTVTFAGR